MRCDFFAANNRIESYACVKVMPDEASVRQDSLRQDSLRQRVAYRAPGFEPRAPKTGARLTEARVHERQTRIY